MRKRRGGITSWHRYKPVKTPTGKVCTPCRKLKMKVQRLERDYADIIKANIRLVMWTKRAGLKLPSDYKLKKKFPLKRYDL